MKCLVICAIQTISSGSSLFCSAGNDGLNAALALSASSSSIAHQATTHKWTDDMRYIETVIDSIDRIIETEFRRCAKDIPN